MIRRACEKKPKGKGRISFAHRLDLAGRALLSLHRRPEIQPPGSAATPANGNFTGIRHRFLPAPSLLRPGTDSHYLAPTPPAGTMLYSSNQPAWFKHKPEQEQ